MKQNEQRKKEHKVDTLLNLCVSSLRRDHANVLWFCRGLIYDRCDDGTRVMHKFAGVGGILE